MNDESKLALWRRHFRTDPKHTKNVSHRGGFTSIDAHTQLEEATSEWGPYGGEWGLRDLSLSFERGDGETPMVSAILSAEFFYPGGAFPIIVDDRFKHGDDAIKKLMTSARSKALSWLGFNADVYCGQFDDKQYVASMTQRFGDQDARLREGLKRAAAAPDDAKLDALRDFVDAQSGEGLLDSSVAEAIRGRIAERREELADASAGPPSDEELIASGELQPTAAASGELFDRSADTNHYAGDL